MMEDDWFLPDIVGQPLQNVSEYHMEKAKKHAQQPSNGPQKKRIGLIRPIFSRKNCKELFTFVSAIVKRHAGKCTMQVFTFSWWDCSANQHLFITVYRRPQPARGSFMLQRLLHTFQNHHQKSK